MSSSLRKIAPRRTHRERAQPTTRRKLGLLEKHKDYVLRARDYHSKEYRIKVMREKARLRNPDEYYYAMEHTNTKDGVHITERQEKFTGDFLKLLKTQDKNYVITQRSINAKKIEKLKAELPLIGTQMSTNEEVDDSKSMTSKPIHTIFVDTEEEVANFDVCHYFDTPKEFLHRRYNRPTQAMLSSSQLPSVVDHVNIMAMKQAERERAAKVSELASRLEREEQLAGVEQEMLVQKALMGNGRPKKVGQDARGLTIFKWRPDRKK